MRIKGVHWFGFETNVFSVHSLWSVSIYSLFKFMAYNKFNAVRVPLSLELVLKFEKTKSTGINTSMNPTLSDVASDILFDIFIQKCKEYGLLVLLDMHLHKASSVIEDLWWTSEYGEGLLSGKNWSKGTNLKHMCLHAILKMNLMAEQLGR